MKLYGYFRSSAAYRVRIALNLKGIVAERASVHLRKGEQNAADYLERNPQGLVPTLDVGDGSVLTQSLAIIEWLDETHPQPPLLPRSAAERARVRGIALAIACDIHPLNNTRVLAYLTNVLSVADTTRDAWYEHWCRLGFSALETQLAREGTTGRFCHGDTPTLADICLVPQLVNGRRVKIDVADYPTLSRIERACNELPAFIDAAPVKQPDAE